GRRIDFTLQPLPISRGDFFWLKMKEKHMPSDEAPLPAAPRGYRVEVKREWLRMAKVVADHGIDPNSRLDLLGAYLRVLAEESDFDQEWEDANLTEKLAIGRRFSALLIAKLRIRALLLAPGGPVA